MISDFECEIWFDFINASRISNWFSIKSIPIHIWLIVTVFFCFVFFFFFNVDIVFVVGSSFSMIPFQFKFYVT